MEIQNVPDYEERPVIDIDVTFNGAPPMGWTINDVADREVFKHANDGFSFDIPETKTRIVIPLQNVAWMSITKRIDKVPVRKSPDMGFPSEPIGGFPNTGIYKG